MWWLIEENVRQRIEHAIQSGMLPTPEQEAQYSARFFDDDEVMARGSRILTIAGNSAEIQITGTLTNAPSFMASIFGGGNTTYKEIIAAIAEAEQNENVEDITLAVDSPGGEFSGFLDAAMAIQAAEKPIKAVISNMGASAAYGLAVQADDVVASNRAAQIGSVGVAARFFAIDEVVHVASTEAPKKRPDVRTEEGKAIVREELDAMHTLFAETIAEGRGIDVKKVNADFGQGATLLAAGALERGMIDSISAVTLTTVVSGAPDEDQPETSVMDLLELKSKHPEVYVLAMQEGVTKERDRVGAHMILGEQSGDMKTASKAIQDGSEMTATLMATYTAAGMNRQDVTTREEEEEEASAAANATGGEDDSEEDVQAEAVLAVVQKQMGGVAA